eukprot:196526_1
MCQLTAIFYNISFNGLPAGSKSVFKNDILISFGWCIHKSGNDNIYDYLLWISISSLCLQIIALIMQIVAVFRKMNQRLLVTSATISSCTSILMICMYFGTYVSNIAPNCYFSYVASILFCLGCCRYLNK